MTMTSDPVDLLRDLNPVPAGSLREHAAERTDDVLRRLRANEIAPRPVRAERRRTHYLAAAAVLAAVAAGSYVLSRPTRAPQIATSVPSSTTPSSRPPPGGTPVQTAAEADALLSFDVVLPSNAAPEYMNVYKWDGRQQLEAYYDTPTDGLYSLSEEPTDWTVANLQEQANAWKTGSAQIVLVDGVHVLVGFDRITPGGETDVGWIRGDGASPVVTWLVGPWIQGQSFSRQQALSVARDIIGKGG